MAEQSAQIVEQYKERGLVERFSEAGIVSLRLLHSGAMIRIFKARSMMKSRDKGIDLVNFLTVKMSRNEFSTDQRAENE